MTENFGSHKMISYSKSNPADDFLKYFQLPGGQFHSVYKISQF